jgi:hypothetical protein
MNTEKRKSRRTSPHGKFVLFFSVSHLVFVTGKESAQSAFDLFWIIVQLNFGQPATKNK